MCRGRHLSTAETWKASKDPRYAAKKARIEHLYALADREITPADGDPAVVFCADEFGPLNLQPHPGRQWAAAGGKGKEPGRAPRPRRRGTYTRTAGVRHLFAACELGEDKLFGISSRVRPGPGSWSSAATCARSTRHRYGSRSSATTTPTTNDSAGSSTGQT
jgi:hypothetical protein